MVSSIANQLGFGSGLDVKQLVTDLAAASRDPKIGRIDAKAKAVQASISAVALVRSDLEGFSSSLSALVAGGSLSSRPLAANAAVLDIKAASGSPAFEGRIEVTRLARSQSSLTPAYADATTTVGVGRLSLSVGSVTTEVTITPGQDGLAGIAAAINGAGTGVTAIVIGDVQGARLLLRGPTGAASGFSLASNDAGLAELASGTTIQQTAQDARVVVDGVPFERPGNVLANLLPGLDLTLKAPGETMVSTERSGEALRTALTDLVSVFNELRTHLLAAKDATRGDNGLRSVERSIAALVAQRISTSGVPNLTALGVRTNRDGSLTFDEGSFRRVYAADPAGVEAVFVPRRDAGRDAVSDPGIGGALATLKASLTGTNGALSATGQRLSRQASLTARERESIEGRETAYKARLERQFGGLDGRVGSLKATQSYLDQQIKIWTSGR